MQSYSPYLCKAECTFIALCMAAKEPKRASVAKRKAPHQRDQGTPKLKARKESRAGPWGEVGEGSPRKIEWKCCLNKALSMTVSLERVMRRGD